MINVSIECASGMYLLIIACGYGQSMQDEGMPAGGGFMPGGYAASWVPQVSVLGLYRTQDCQVKVLACSEVCVQGGSDLWHLRTCDAPLSKYNFCICMSFRPHIFWSTVCEHCCAV